MWRLTVLVRLKMFPFASFKAMHTVLVHGDVFFRFFLFMYVPCVQFYCHYCHYFFTFNFIFCHEDLLSVSNSSWIVIISWKFILLNQSKSCWILTINNKCSRKGSQWTIAFWIIEIFNHSFTDKCVYHLN